MKAKIAVNYLKPEEYEEKFGMSKKALEEYIAWRISTHHAIQFRDKEIGIAPLEKQTGFARKGMKSRVYKVDILSDPIPYEKPHLMIKEQVDVQSMRSMEPATERLEAQTAILKVSNNIGRRAYEIANREISLFPRLYSDEGLLKYTQKKLMLLEWVGNLTLEERMEESADSPKKIIHDALDPVVILFRHFSLPHYVKLIEENLHKPLNTFNPAIFIDKLLRHTEIIFGQQEGSLPRNIKSKLNEAFTKLSKYFDSKAEHLIDIDGRAKHNMINSLIDPQLMKGDPAFHLGYLLCDWNILHKLSTLKIEEALGNPEDIIDMLLTAISKKDDHLIKELNIENAKPLDAERMRNGVYAAGIARNIEDFAGVEFYLINQLGKEDQTKLREDMWYKIRRQLQLSDKVGLTEAKEIEDCFIEFYDKNNKNNNKKEEKNGKNGVKKIVGVIKDTIK